MAHHNVTGPLKQLGLGLPSLNFRELANSISSTLRNVHLSPPVLQKRQSRPERRPGIHTPRSHSIPSYIRLPELISVAGNLQLSESSVKLQKNDETAAQREYERISGFCSACGIPFIDDSFPHSLRSLGNLCPDNGPGAVPCEIDAKELIWLRPQDMFTKDGQRYRWTVFRDPKPTDIEQGALGNCWFLSALAVIAERPDILEQIVLTKQYNPTGLYQIRLCVDGKWQVVVLDDFFPCRKRSRTLAFAVGRRNQLWVPLIEKAFAKITGSYGKLLAGRALEGLAVLTGSPCALVDLEGATDPEARNFLWASLLSMREANFVMGCSCGAGKRPVDKDAYLACGLQPRHAYSLLNVIEYCGCRLVRLRNPWGTFVWNGEWSDNWPGWTVQSRSFLLPNGFEAGAFWMPFDQFLRHFDSVEVAKVRSLNGWKELRTSFGLNPSWGRGNITAFRIHVENATEIAVTLHQKEGRDETETDLMVLIHKIGTSDLVGRLITRSARKMAAFVATNDVFLQGPQEYYLIPVSFSNINSGKVLNLVITLHSAKPLLSEMIDLPAVAVTDSLIQLALKESRERVSGPGMVSRYVMEEFDGHLLLYDNLHQSDYVQVCCDCSASMNVISTRSTLRSVDSIPPLHRQIIMILSHFEATQSYSLYHTLTERVNSSKELQDWAYYFPVTGYVSFLSQHVPQLGSTPADVLHQPRPISFSYN